MVVLENGKELDAVGNIVRMFGSFHGFGNRRERSNCGVLRNCVCKLKTYLRDRFDQRLMQGRFVLFCFVLN